MKGNVTLALCGALFAAFGPVGNVCARSPFSLESSPAPEPVVPPTVPLELRGIVLDDSGTRFGFYNLKNGRSTWIGLGQPMDGFVVKSHDEETNLITAEYEGHTFTMTLKAAKIEPPLSGEVQPPSGGNDAIRAEILHRKVLRLRSQKSRLQKILTK